MIQFITSIAARSVVKKVAISLATGLAVSMAAETIIAGRADDVAWENLQAMDDETKRPHKVKRVPGELWTGLVNTGKGLASIGYIVAVPFRFLRYKQLAKQSSKADTAARDEVDDVVKAKKMARATLLHDKTIQVLEKLVRRSGNRQTKGERLYYRTVSHKLFPPTPGTEKYGAATKPEWLDTKHLVVSGDQVAKQWISGETKLTNYDLYGLYNGDTVSLDHWLQQLMPMSRTQLDAFKLGVQSRISHEIRLGTLAFAKEASTAKEVKDDKKPSTAKEAK